MKRFLHQLFLTAAILVMACPATALAQQDYTPLQGALVEMDVVDTGKVVKIIKVDQIELDNGKIYNLDNIRIPLVFNQKATAFMTAALMGRNVGVFVNKKKPEGLSDRYGIPLVHIARDDNVWVQGALVFEGIAWATSTPTSRDLVVPLYSYEELARKEHKGLWAGNLFPVRTSDKEMDADTNSFQVYEGIVKSLRKDKEGNTFLHFGDDRKTDFTAVIKSGVMGTYSHAGGISNLRAAVENASGKHVRVRGWVLKLDGPYIDITHPEQIEFLPAVKK